MGHVSLGLLGKSGHFRQWRTRAYEHRLGPNSGRSLTESQPCSPLAWPAPRQGLQSPWTTFFIFAVLTLTLGVQMKTLGNLNPKIKRWSMSRIGEASILIYVSEVGWSKTLPNN